MKFTVKVEGLSDCEAALRELPKATGKNVLRRVARQALQPFDQRWRQLAPKDTGALARSGGIGTKLTRRQSRLQRAEDKDGKASIVMFAGPGGDPAAVQQEFGNYDQAAQPFGRPAWEGTQGKALEIIQTSLWTEIKAAADRLARKAARLAAKG